MKELPGKDSQRRKTRKGQLGKDIMDRTADSQDRTARTGLPRRGSKDRTARTGQPGWDSHDRTADRIAWMRYQDGTI
jgi:hypothetical protein